VEVGRRRDIFFDESPDFERHIMNGVLRGETVILESLYFAYSYSRTLCIEGSEIGGMEL